MSTKRMRTWDEYKQTMRAEEDLHVFARAGNVEGLGAVLLEESIDRPDPKGYSALMLAAYHGHADAVRFLLGAGANPNGRDVSGNTILMGAAFKGHVDVVRRLVEAGADIAARNPRGQTALQFAQMFGRTEVVNYLKGLRHQPQGARWRDIVAGWYSFLFPQRSVK